MKIALFCSSRNEISSLRNGGTEQSIYYLALGLASRGHQVTLYAAKKSKVPGVKIKEISPWPVKSQDIKFINIKDRIASFYDLTALADFFKNEIDNYDIIQYNSFSFHEILPFVRYTTKPIVIRINYPHKFFYRYTKKYLKQCRSVYFLPVSKFIKTILPGLNYLKPIYIGIDMNDFEFSGKSGDYLLHIGRICFDKGAHIAISIAKKIGKKLIIAGGMTENHHRKYFQDKIAPFIDGRQIIYLGEVGFKEKVKLYQSAQATLFPILWDEPFANVPIESMACGTPVISFNTASAREAIKDKKTGFLVNNKAEMIKAVKNINIISRLLTRQWAEKYFSLNRCIDDYEKIYEKIVI